MFWNHAQTALLLAALAVGAPHKPTDAAEPNGPDLFAKLDANGDGQLTAGEVEAEHRLLFKRLLRTGDENGDGQLTAGEFAAAIQPVRAEKPKVEKQGSRLPGADALVVLLARMDANGDGQLLADEIPADCERAFEQMLTAADGNKDGRLDRREIAQASPRLTAVANLAARRMGLDVAAEMSELPEETMASMEQMDAYPKPGELAVARLLKQFDRNEDGAISRGEAPPMLKRQFERFDVDGDRQLRGKELAKVGDRLAQIARNAETRNEPRRPAANKDSSGLKSSRKLKK
jgi:Ca2+-binding EF-hand superfamily protein